MFAKILAGAFAAVAVTGGGIYFATSDCHSGCPFSCKEQAPVPVSSDAPSCCSLPATCTVPEASPNESLGACMGASTLASTSQAKGACCPIE